MFYIHLWRERQSCYNHNRLQISCSQIVILIVFCSDICPKIFPLCVCGCIAEVIMSVITYGSKNFQQNIAISSHLMHLLTHLVALSKLLKLVNKIVCFYIRNINSYMWVYVLKDWMVKFFFIIYPILLACYWFFLTLFYSFPTHLLRRKISSTFPMHPLKTNERCSFLFNASHTCTFHLSVFSYIRRWICSALKLPHIILHQNTKIRKLILQRRYFNEWK